MNEEQTQRCAGCTRSVATCSVYMARPTAAAAIVDGLYFKKSAYCSVISHRNYGQSTNKKMHMAADSS